MKIYNGYERLPRNYTLMSDEYEFTMSNGYLSNNKEKTKFLEQIMGVQKSFNIKPQNNIDDDQLEYDIRLAKFLEGSWRTL